MITCTKCGKQCLSTSGFTLHKCVQQDSKPAALPEPEVHLCNGPNDEDPETECGKRAHYKIAYDQGDGELAFLFACKECKDTVEYELESQGCKPKRVSRLVGVPDEVKPKPRKPTPEENEVLSQKIHEVLSKYPTPRPDIPW